MTKRKHTKPTKVSYREGRGVYKSSNSGGGCVLIIVAALALSVAVMAAGTVGLVAWLT